MSSLSKIGNNVSEAISYAEPIQDPGLIDAEVLPERTQEGYRTDLLDSVELPNNAALWVVSRQAFRNHSVRKSSSHNVTNTKSKANAVYEGLADHIRYRHLGHISSQDVEVIPCSCPLHGFTNTHFARPNLGSGYNELAREVVITPSSLVETWEKDQLKTIPARSGMQYISGRLEYHEISRKLATTSAFPLLVKYVETLSRTKS